MNLKNAGGADRIVRLLSGTAVLAAGISPAFQGMAKAVAMALGALLMATAVLGRCPLYLPLGISTCRKG